MQHIVLNVTKFLHCGFCVACRTVHAVEVLRLKFVKDQHFYGMGGPTRSTNVRTGIPITFNTMPSMLALSEVACPLAAYGTLNIVSSPAVPCSHSVRRYVWSPEPELLALIPFPSAVIIITCTPFLLEV